MQQTNELILCGSFAKKAGTMGSVIHTAAAKFHGLNFAYKSFAVDNIEDAIKAMRVLKLRGVGISMPYKIEVMKHLDFISEEAADIGAVNTVVNNDGVLAGYNTDWIAAREMIKKYCRIQDLKGTPFAFILGNGGFAKAVRYAFKKEGYHPCCLQRTDWNNLPNMRDTIIFNCTPVENVKVDGSNIFIDGLVSTPTGKEIAVMQAGVQFQLYTGKEFPLHFLKRAGIV